MNRPLLEVEGTIAFRGCQVWYDVAGAADAPGNRLRTIVSPRMLVAVVIGGVRYIESTAMRAPHAGQFAGVEVPALAGARLALLPADPPGRHQGILRVHCLPAAAPPARRTRASGADGPREVCGPTCYNTGAPPDETAGKPVGRRRSLRSAGAAAR
ncbi:MAG TPA: hypothetical protein VM536_07615 [Chloroflexia bacterium]|nr:hypothetical protein [Chloroflexia bacterium]